MPVVHGFESIAQPGCIAHLRVRFFFFPTDPRSMPWHGHVDVVEHLRSYLVYQHTPVNRSINLSVRRVIIQLRWRKTETGRRGRRRHRGEKGHGHGHEPGHGQGEQRGHGRGHQQGEGEGHRQEDLADGATLKMSEKRRLCRSYRRPDWSCRNCGQRAAPARHSDVVVGY